MGLFDRQEADNLQRAMPLAARMRPRTIDEFAGQQHFLGPGKLLRRMLDADRLVSVIFYGPPGTGKTSLAEVISRQTQREFVPLNAASCGVKELRAALDKGATASRPAVAAPRYSSMSCTASTARSRKSMLPDVESGVVALIGATTANPFFSLVSPLISRSQVFEFQHLSKEDVLALLRRALADAERGLARYKTTVTDEALDFLAEVSDGDARRALKRIEVAVVSAAESQQTVDLVVARTRSRKRRFNTTPRGTSTTTRPAPSSRACGAAIPTRRRTGWPACWRPARIRGFSPGES